MLDLKLLRSEPERVKAALARRGAGGEVDELLTLDARRRELLPEVEDDQAERHAAPTRIGEIQRGGGAAPRPGASARSNGRGAPPMRRSPLSGVCARRSTPAKRSWRRSRGRC